MNLAEPTFTQGTYTGLRVSPPSRTGTRMTTDFHSAVQSGRATRRATSALYTGRTGQKVILLTKLQSVTLQPQGPISSKEPLGGDTPIVSGEGSISRTPKLP